MMLLKVVNPDNDIQIIIIKEARCKTSPNGNCGLYNIFAGNILKYEVIKAFEKYKLYKVYDEINPINNTSVELTYDEFRIYFKPVKLIYS